jgi:Xaa-Pro aminopeptidase
MDPFESGEAELDLAEVSPEPEANGVHSAPAVAPPPVALAARRADIDVKQAQVAWLLEQMECEAALFLVPSHVAWFTAGMNVRGLLADSERPGVYTNGKQRWLLCSNVDTQRLFDEELDQLGFQLKEWTWEGGRADLLMNITTGRRVCGDRPFPNMPQVTERLRPLLRVLSAFEQDEYRALGRLVAHAVEATARNIGKGDTEAEVAGHLAHRLLHRGAEVAAVSVTADNRGAKFRRAGFTTAPVNRTCVIQATAQRGGLFATASRAISFGPPPDDFRTCYDLSLRLAALYRSVSRVDESMASARKVGQTVLAKTDYEHEGRMAAPGYGAGRFPAEELRRAGQDEHFAAGQALVWQPRVGPAAVVDTVVVGIDGPECVTLPEEWPFKRVLIHGKTHDIPDIWVRSE